MTKSKKPAPKRGGKRTAVSKKATVAKPKYRKAKQRPRLTSSSPMACATSTTSALQQARKPRFRFRDAITDLFVRARDALRRKKTTVRERMK